MAEIAYNLSAFCENYELDTKACAAELLSFSNFYHRTPNADEENSSMSDIGVFYQTLIITWWTAIHACSELIR